MTQPKHKSPHARFYAVFGKMTGADKETLVWQYSNMLTTSLNEFKEKSPQGYNAMIIDLEKKFPKKPKETTRTEAEAETKKLRSGILHRLQKHGIDTTDWDCVNRFLESPKIAGKRLYNMTSDEMKDFIRKMESILKKDTELRQQIENTAKLN